MLMKKRIEKMYQTQMFRRCDNTEYTFYYSYKDFEGLHRHCYPFASSKGHKLQGYFYHYDQYDQNRILVFDHGHGGGHEAYMKEIEILCRQGYCVFAYDHTGCMASQGEHTNGLTQSLVDLNDCLNTLKKDDNLNQCTFSVIGHSWGGYSCLNISRFHPDITHIVVLSGFISVSQMAKQNLTGLLKYYQKVIYNIEKSANPEVVDFNAIDTLNQTTAKVLLIYSDNDPLVKKEFHYDILREQLSHRSNIQFLLTHNKGHNPNYTEDAVSELNTFLKERNKAIKSKVLETKKQRTAFLQSFDWNKITRQDLDVWQVIFNHLIYTSRGKNATLK